MRSALMKIKINPEADENLNGFCMLKRAIASCSERKLLKFISDLFLVRFILWNLFQLLET